MIKTKEQFIIENEELRSRLAEIEDALTAIRNGEVDAIMVSGSKAALLKHPIVLSSSQ